MPRALKVFKTHLGFYDLIVAAPSMKAAAAAWETDTRLFAQGFAALSDDREEVSAALAEPGMVLRRPHGQPGAWQINPAAITAPKPGKRRTQDRAKAEREKKAAEKKAAAAAERQAKQRARDELKNIEKQEAALRGQRRALQKKFHLHSVK